MEKVITVILVLALVAAGIALSSAIVMWLWNWIAVGLFSAPVIGFWKGFGILALCSFLFKGSVTIKTKRG